jgi:hypothetical protein
MRENALLHPRLGQPQQGEPQTGEYRSAPSGRSLEEANATSAARAESADSSLDKRYPLALVLFVLLAVLVWFTMDSGKVLVLGKPVELRWVPLIIIGGLALRTVLARQADRIRRGGDERDSKS